MEDISKLVPALDVDNYASWSVRMKAVLISKGLWKPVSQGLTRHDHKGHRRAGRVRPEGPLSDRTQLQVLSKHCDRTQLQALSDRTQLLPSLLAVEQRNMREQQDAMHDSEQTAYYARDGRAAVQCWACGEHGHVKKNCLKKKHAARSYMANVAV